MRNPMNTSKMYFFLVFGCLLLSWTDAFVTTTDNSLRTERDLRRDLFATYDKLARPVKDPKTTINLQVALTPIMIREVDEKHQNIVLEGWVLMKWNDDFLTWDPSKYSNINVLRVPSSEVWKPDLALYTASPMDSLFPVANTQVLLYPNGSVLWVPTYTMSSRCPFLKQVDKSYVMCNIKMGSWTFSAKELELQLQTKEVDVSSFQDINPDWKVIDFKSDRQSKYYPCCPGEDYPNINFNVTMKRRSTKEEWSLGY